MADFDSLTLRGRTFQPARFSAPLAGLTHSALRRLVADFGGCGALFTEMLAAKLILHEDLRLSPALRRRPGEPPVIYQLMISDTDRLDRVAGRLGEIGADGLDVNLGCHAPYIRRRDAGSGLWSNPAMLADVLETLRRCWAGPLTVKIRLGHEAPGWEAVFAARLRLFEACGVDALTLHARFYDDRCKRRARHEYLAQAASVTRLPLIANGDITGGAAVRASPGRFGAASGLMVGRMAVVQPWVFAAWDGPVTVDRAEVWRRMRTYLLDDFPPARALLRLKHFTAYFARNFRFGHTLFGAVQSAPTLAEAEARAEAFLAATPELAGEPNLSGL